MAKFKDLKQTETGPSKYSKLQDKLLEHNRELFARGSLKDVYRSISHGDNSYLRVNRVETSEFDKSWIEEIENCIPELEEIVNNPRRNIATEGNVVPVELAKKTSSESVRHLATHTQYIKEIKEDGDVVPSKILSLSSDDFYGIYENRFIATLIRRLVLFIEKRYEFIVEHALLKNTEEMRMKSRAIIDGSVVEMETKVKVIKPADYGGIEDKNAFIDRVINVRDHLRYCYTSEFMKLLKTEKDVRNPIIMTNIIRKNPLYHKCYNLWRYIESYTSAGISYSVNHASVEFTKEMIAEMNAALTASFLAVRSANPSRYSFVKEKVYKPKIIRGLDDEEFEYGPYLAGPIEFVRVDEAYRKATEETNTIYRDEDVYDQSAANKGRRSIVHGMLTREEEEYIKDLRLENHAIELMREAKDQLMNRKRRESVAFDKKALKLIQSRLAEEREMRAKLSRDELLRQLILEKEAIDSLINRAVRDFSIGQPKPTNEDPQFEPPVLEEQEIQIPEEQKAIVESPDIKDLPNIDEMVSSPIAMNEVKSQEENKPEIVSEKYDHKNFINEWLKNIFQNKIEIIEEDFVSSDGLSLLSKNNLEIAGEKQHIMDIYQKNNELILHVKSDEKTGKVIRKMGYHFERENDADLSKEENWYNMVINNTNHSHYVVFVALEILIKRLFQIKG